MEEQSGHVLSGGPPSLISLRRGSVSAECLEPLAVPMHSVSGTSRKSETERHQIEEAVTGNLLFKGLDRCQLDVIIDAMVPRSVGKGEAVFCQGDPGDFFYVVASGHFFVMIDNEKRADIVRGPRGFFGELALLYNCPRTATLVAGEDSKLWLWIVLPFDLRRCFVDEKTAGHLGSGEYFGERALLTFEQRQATVLATTPLHCLALDASSFTRLLGPLLDILNRTPGSD
ncbi:unnamed protein product [Sphagnum compactum]